MIVVFRSAKERPFAERKATLLVPLGRRLKWQPLKLNHSR